MQPAFPINPFGGQEYVDAWRIKWVYDAEQDNWTMVGVVLDVPIARPPDSTDGPTNGLLSAASKTLLDKLPDKAGGFGILLKPGYYITPDKGADNILTGDIQLISETLQFTCLNDTGSSIFGPIPTIKIALSNDFLQAYSLNIKGPKGKTGEVGNKGRSGRPGTGDGPVGDPGPDGQDAATHHTLSGIKYVELDSVYDTAVVGLRLDPATSTLEVTKAKMDVPGDNRAASRVAATPVVRDVEFTGSDLSSWQLVAPGSDSASTDLNLVKLPKGWSGQSGTPVPVTPVKLSTVVQSIVDYYQTQANTIITQWEAALRDWVSAKDKEARQALFSLATEVAECQFQLPLEMCVGIKKVPCTNPDPPVSPAGGPTATGSVVVIVLADEAPGYDGQYAIYSADREQASTFYNRFPCFQDNLIQSKCLVGILIPCGATVKALGPSNNVDLPLGWTASTTGSTPTTLDLLNIWTSIISTQASGSKPYIGDITNVIILVDDTPARAVPSELFAASLEPGLGNFISLLRSTTNANIVEVPYTSERWAAEVSAVLSNLGI